MAAGLAQLRELERSNGWRKLEELGASLEQGIRGLLKGRGDQFTFHRVGSMFCLFCAGGPVANLADAQRSDRKAFAAFFHRCLDAGLYLAPSQFETGFISLAHTPADIEQTIRIIADALPPAP
jgi:glutamate-1-semialdehyde 2,1-aminomutase